MKHAVLSLLLIWAAGTSASAKCSFSALNLYPNFDTSQSAEADSGKPCSEHFVNTGERC